MQIGFIGLGQMGRGMASRLIDSRELTYLMDSAAGRIDAQSGTA